MELCSYVGSPLPVLMLLKYVGLKNDNGEWRMKYNNELYTLYKESDIVTFIKINRLKWAGHVIRMEEQSPTRRVLVAVVERRRQRGRPKLR